MTNKKETQNKGPAKAAGSRRERRGVGAIIGGTILAMILFTSVFAYFFVFLQNQSTQGKGELQASRIDEEKRLETLVASSIKTPVLEGPGILNPKYLIPIILNNTGSLPVDATYAVVSRVDDPANRLETPLQLLNSTLATNPAAKVLNPGESAIFFVPAKDIIPDPTKIYHIDIISTRGNIISTQWPPVQTNGSGGGGGIGIGVGTGTGQNNTGINVGTGTANVYAGMTGEKLKFRTIKGDGTTISVTNNTDTITISSIGGSSGEANDGLRLGCGLPSPPPADCMNVYAGKDPGSVHLKFYSLIAGTGVRIMPDPNNSDNYLISATGEANRGQNATSTGSAIYKGMNGANLTFRTIQGTGGTTTKYSADGNTVLISSPEESDIVQGTGVIQLDFKSFGVMFPQYQLRNGVDQTGFSARSANATGYPAFMIPAGPQAYLVERVRNLDPAGNTINLGRSSGMTISQGKCPSGQCAPVFLCKAINDINGNLASPPTPLNDPTTSVSIPPTPRTAGKYVGWQDVALCSNAQNSVSAWNVQGQMSNINSAFMVARGYYAGTNFAYAQTIPYQSIIVANQGAPNLGNGGISSPNMIACLRNSDVNTSCVSPTGIDASTTLKYRDTATNMGAGLSQIRIHVNNNCNCGYNVSWIYPGTGKAVNLATIPTISWQLNGNNNLANAIGNTAITLPTTMEDGVTPIVSGYYTIMLTTGYDSNSERDAYYFTFRVDP